MRIPTNIKGAHSVSQLELARYNAAKAAGLKTILFVCSGNAIRSQIAEGLVNHFFSGKWAAFSAGIIPIPIPGTLTKVMREIGIDISKRQGKHIDIFSECDFDRMVVLCSDIDRFCPVLPACRVQETIIFSDPLSSILSYEGCCFGFASAFRDLRDEMNKVLTEYMKEA
jgi:arsenate reductase